MLDLKLSTSLPAAPPVAPQPFLYHGYLDILVNYGFKPTSPEFLISMLEHRCKRCLVDIGAKWHVTYRAPRSLPSKAVIQGDTILHVMARMIQPKDMVFTEMLEHVITLGISSSARNTDGDTAIDAFCAHFRGYKLVGARPVAKWTEVVAAIRESHDAPVPEPAAITPEVAQQPLAPRGSFFTASTGASFTFSATPIATVPSAFANTPPVTSFSVPLTTSPPALPSVELPPSTDPFAAPFQASPEFTVVDASKEDDATPTSPTSPTTKSTFFRSKKQGRKK